MSRLLHVRSMRLGKLHALIYRAFHHHATARVKKHTCNMVASKIRTWNHPSPRVSPKVLLSLGSSVLETHDTPRRKASKGRSWRVSGNNGFVSSCCRRA